MLINNLMSILLDFKLQSIFKSPPLLRKKKNPWCLHTEKCHVLELESHLIFTPFAGANDDSALYIEIIQII